MAALKNKDVTSVWTLLSVVVLAAAIISAIFLYKYIPRWIKDFTTIQLPDFVKDNLPPQVIKFLGFGMVQPIGESLWIGFWAAILLYAIYLVIRWARKIRGRDDITKKDYEEYTEKRTRWLNIIVGRAWKIPLITIFYTILMQIPILNRVIDTILLNFWTERLGAKVFMLAFWLGLLPSLIENFWKSMIQLKYEKKANEVLKGVALSRAHGQTTQR